MGAFQQIGDNRGFLFPLNWNHNIKYCDRKIGIKWPQRSWKNLQSAKATRADKGHQEKHNFGMASKDSSGANTPGSNAKTW